MAKAKIPLPTDARNLSREDVHAALTGVEGVRAVREDARAGVIEVEYDERVVDEPLLRRAVDDIGEPPRDAGYLPRAHLR